MLPRLPRCLPLGLVVVTAVTPLRSMAASADHIPDVLVGVELTTERREEFFALAGGLRDGAHALADQTPSLSVAGLRERLEDLAGSCRACHERFRVMPTLRSR